MKIEKIEIIRLAIPFDSGREKSGSEQQDYNAASSRVTKMETLLVAVYSDTGLCGWGEAFGHLINPVTFTALESAVAPFFINRQFDSVTEIEALMKDAEQAFHGFGRTGPVRCRLSILRCGTYSASRRRNRCGRCLAPSATRLGSIQAW